MTEPSVRFFPRRTLELREDIPGAAYWAVAHRHAMLSYFEVEPGVRFDTHRHEAEQITFVQLRA